MIYTVHFMTTASGQEISRPVLCAAFLCEHEAVRYAKEQGANTFKVAKVDGWSAWENIKKNVPHV